MRALSVLISLPLAVVLLAPVHAREVLTGASAFGTWKGDAPGVSRHIKPADLPQPSHHENDPEAPDFDLKPKVVASFFKRCRRQKFRDNRRPLNKSAPSNNFACAAMAAGQEHYVS